MHNCRTAWEEVARNRSIRRPDSTGAQAGPIVALSLSGLRMEWQRKRKIPFCQGDEANSLVNSPGPFQHKTIITKGVCSLSWSGSASCTPVGLRHRESPHLSPDTQHLLRKVIALSLRECSRYCSAGDSHHLYWWHPMCTWFESNYSTSSPAAC